MSGVHFQNVDGWGEYLATLGQGRLPLRRARGISPAERLTRELILQLKLGEVRSDYFRQKFGADILQEFAGPLERLETEGMLRPGGDGVRLSRKGLLRVDSLLPEFYDDRYRDARYT